MATRPSWTGHLRFSLVTIAVQLYSGSKSTRNIPLHQLHKPTLKRVHNQPTVEGLGPIDKKDIVKGYEYKKGSHVVLTPEELDKIRLETNKTINITEFADAAEIDEIYYDKPYYIVPEDDIAREAYTIFQHALKKTGKVAVGEVILSGKEHLVAIKPYGKGMLMETLRYADEVKSAHSYFADLNNAAPDKDQLDLAISLIKKKSAKFDPSDFDDSYETALHELIERKLKKLPLEEKGSKKTTKIVNLMDALRKSLGDSEEEDTAPAAKSAKKATKKKAPAKAAAGKKAVAKKKAPAKQKRA
ncbi:MAG: Ku protein [Chitinophagaceae bacterium]|nr:Ku protein [Chitinophagaceae bacterium]